MDNPLSNKKVDARRRPEMQYRNYKHIAFTYPTHRPRPDIAFPFRVRVVGQFMKAPRLPHWGLLYVRYLKKALGQCCISPMDIFVLKVLKMQIGPVLHQIGDPLSAIVHLREGVEKSKAKCRCSF